ncbi:MAG: cobalamin-dependent protein [Candidatus Poribacteria bacterium]|nr:cobalamin-dependent protein [Candidatus Poribacteria bacterium]
MESEVETEALNQVWKNTLLGTLKDFSPNLVGISCTFTMNHETMLEISEFVKSYDQSIITVVGGVHVTNARQHIFLDASHIDYLSLYEAEESFIRFPKFLNGELEAKNLYQIATFSDGEYYELSDTHPPTSLALDITPSYGFLNIGDFSNLGEIGTFRYWRPKDSKGTSILANKGCRARCSFCSVGNFNGKAVEGKAHLESLLASTWPSQKIELEYLRQNSKECLLVTLGELDQTAASEERLLDFLDASNINIGMVSKIPTPLSSATVNSARSNPQKSSNQNYQQDQATNAMHFWIGLAAIIGISRWWHLGWKKRQQLRRSAVTYLRQEMRNLVSLGASRIDLAQFLEQMGLQVDGNFYQISQVTGVANVPVPTHNRPVLISAELTSALLAEVENRLQRLETEAEQALHDHFMALVSTSETVTGLIQQVVVNPDQFQMQEGQFRDYI